MAGNVQTASIASEDADRLLGVDDCLLNLITKNNASQPSTGGTRRGSEAAAPEAGGPCGWVAGTSSSYYYR